MAVIGARADDDDEQLAHKEPRSHHSAANDSKAPKEGELVTLEPPDDDSSLPFSRREAAKLIALFVIILGVVLLSRRTGGAIKALRSEVRSVPLAVVLPGFLLVSAMRKLCPPLYYIFPVGSLFAMYCVDKLGIYSGAVAYELTKLQDVAYFAIIRYLFSKAVGDVFASNAMESRWLSANLQQALCLVDETWRVRTYERHLLTQALVIVSLTISYYVEDYLILVWLATRSGIVLPWFAASFVLAIIFEYPKTVLKLRAYKLVADAVSGAEADSLWDQFLTLPWHEVLLALVLPLVATLYVHGTHVLAILASLRRRCYGKPAEKPPATQPQSFSEQDTHEPNFDHELSRQ